MNTENDYMDDVTDVRVETAILHILDSKGDRGLICSECPIPTSKGGDRRIFEYFEAHIVKALRDPEARKARFDEVVADEASGICESLLRDGEAKLVGASAALANKLFCIMSKNKSISVGDLVTCLCTAKNGDDGMRRFLALLKIDSSTGFIQTTAEQGRLTYVTLDLGHEVEVLPTAREELQKLAFIGELDPGRDYDMILLDRQLHPAGERAVARFFTEEFLGAEEVLLDARPQTRVLHSAFVRLKNMVRGSLEPREMAAVEALHAEVLDARAVDLDEVGERLPEAARAAYADMLPVDQVPVRQIQIDGAFAQRVKRIRRFRGAGGLKVEVKADFYGDVVQSVRRIRPGLGNPYYRVTLHTEAWEELS